MIDFAVREEPLGTLRRDGREAAATLRIYSFGRELRITVGADMVFGRWLRDDHDQRLVDDILRTFLGDGWVPALSA